jgi:sulfite reductase (ferredoxin)
VTFVTVGIEHIRFYSASGGQQVSKINVEGVKEHSDGLRGSLASDLQNAEPTFSEENKHLLKFHGVYQQHDRDSRRGETHENYHQFMIRSKVPGGQLTAAQYLAHDRIAADYANGTLRITTRECFQLHGVIKGDLWQTIHELNAALVTTFGACGDVVRNVMACPAPSADPQRIAVQEYALKLNQALFPRTTAYHQIWVDGEAATEDKEIPDPLYGKTYLPRKFKIAIAYAGDNCVDVFTNDVGLVALFDNENQLVGFNILAGGGMGMTHNNTETFPRLADIIGFVRPDQVIEIVEGIVKIHRDLGNRENRKQARLKYILHEIGLEQFRAELQNRVSFALQSPQPMPPFAVYDHLGWHEQGDGHWYVGIPVESGRILDNDHTQLRTGLRTIIEEYDLPIRLTAQQNILLTNIKPEDRPTVEAMLIGYRIKTLEQISEVRRYALACPALPTCSLAITEAERVLPQLLDEFEALLNDIGIPDDTIVLRMTGCPNGCARPYMAEIGLVGRALNKYTLFLGGNFIGTRLAESFLDLVHFNDIIPTLRPILIHYRDTRLPEESFGDFVVRVGFTHLRELITPMETTHVH